jgi:hypothetical protein
MLSQKQLFLSVPILTCTACLKLLGSAESNMTAATSSWAKSRQGSSAVAALLAYRARHIGHADKMW